MHQFPHTSLVPRQKLGWTLLLFFLLTLLMSWSCRPRQTMENPLTATLEPAPQTIRDIFAKYPKGVMRFPVKSPGKAYRYDVADKDPVFGNKDGVFAFDSVEIRLKNRMAPGQVLVHVVLTDSFGSILEFVEVDLMKIVPQIDAPDDMRLPEILMEEFNRYGVSFRRVKREFQLVSAVALDRRYGAASFRAMHASLTNNCLDPGKWEVEVWAVKNDLLHHDRMIWGKETAPRVILAHSWLQVDPDLYGELLRLKNPFNAYNPESDFKLISEVAQKIVVDFEVLRRPVRKFAQVEVVEVGHRSARKIEALDIEQFYKAKIGLQLNRRRDQTYSSILDGEVEMARFADEGFYRTTDPKVFEFDWLRKIDDVELKILDVKDSDTHVELKLTGDLADYEVTIGNVDLAWLTRQERLGLLFGLNTYPKSRLHNAEDLEGRYDPENIDNDRKPYVLLTDMVDGTWVNNMDKGVEKVY
ncbi:MAG: hypothetical protein AAF570_22550, partial [Bacteroidota bacterium]